MSCINNRIWIVVVACLGIPVFFGTVAYVGLPDVPGFEVEVYAELENPVGLAFDPDGVLFAGNNVAFGPIYRIPVGGGKADLYGDGSIDPDPVVFDTDGLISGVPGAVLTAGSNFPVGQIDAILPDQSVVTLFGPTTDFINVRHMVFDNNDRLLIADENGNGGGALQSTGEFPTSLIPEPSAVGSVAVDRLNRIYTTPYFTGRVWLYEADGTLVDDAFATGMPDFTALAFGLGDEVWGSDLYAIGLEEASGDLFRIDPCGNTTVIGTGFNDVGGMAFGADGALYISDKTDDLIYRVVTSGPACPWDITDDGLVNPGDLLILLGWWGQDPGGPPDFNGDGVVNAIDLIELLGNWGPCPK